MSDTLPSIIDELSAKLSNIKDKLKESNLTSVAFDELTSNAKLIQDKLNDLFQKKGFYTQSDINDAYEVLKEAKRKELELMKKKANKKLIIYSSIILGIGIGAYLLFKKK
jgi:glutamine synthetase type III